MIARHEAQTDAPVDVWHRIAAPVDPATIEWRQDGRPTARDGKFFARFVPYIEANTVRERLDAVVPGEWSLTLEPLATAANADRDGVDAGDTYAFKARLQILGVVREDVGTGKDHKQAATDAFKRAAVRFGVGHELYSSEQNWVAVDGDGRYAKPLEAPMTAYVRRYGAPPAHDKAPAATIPGAEVDKMIPGGSAPEALPFSRGAVADDVPPCPKCGGKVWDNRIGKRNSKAPDFKCRDRGCDGVVWPPRESDSARRAAGVVRQATEAVSAAPTGRPLEDIEADEHARQDDDSPF